MALEKSIPFKGATLTYHKIGDAKPNYIAGNTTVSLLSYTDKATRDANPEDHLMGQYIVLPGLPPTAPAVDDRTWAYDWLKGGTADAPNSVDFYGSADA